MYYKIDFNIYIMSSHKLSSHKITGAGVLLITKFDDKFCIIVGKEKNKSKKVEYGIWEDFGGSIDSNEVPFETARRELYEETACLIKLDNNKFIHFKDFESDIPGEYYRQFFIRLKTFPLNDFHKNYKKLIKMKADDHLLEINNITYIPFKYLDNLSINNKNLAVIKDIFNTYVNLSIRLTEVLYRDDIGINYIKNNIKRFKIINLRKKIDKLFTYY